MKAGGCQTFAEINSSNRQMGESELVRKCRRGSPQAQKALFDTYANRFYRLMIRYVKVQQDAEDLVMVGFTKVFDHIHKFELVDEGGLEAWMRKIMVNQALMWLRRKHNFNLTETLDSANPEHDLEGLQDLDGEYLYQLILELPAGYRTVFNLAIVEGYDHNEIASMLGINEGTSRSQLFKARQILKRKILEEGFQYGT